MIDLNSDVGESFGRYTLGNDEELMPFVTSANIACGLHAGDPVVMDHTVRLARAYGVDIGAHPSLPDLQGFGRRAMEISSDEAEAFVLYQIGALAAFVRDMNGELTHVKAHGALYNQAVEDRRLADAVARAVYRFDPSLILVALSGSDLLEAGREAGLRVASEAFADRAYEPDGTLRSRTFHGALLENPEEAARQALSIARDGVVIAHDGSRVAVQADTICLHGDTPGALAIARAVRKALNEAGVEVKPLSEFIGG